MPRRMWTGRMPTLGRHHGELRIHSEPARLSARHSLSLARPESRNRDSRFSAPEFFKLPVSAAALAEPGRAKSAIEQAEGAAPQKTPVRGGIASANKNNADRRFFPGRAAIALPSPNESRTSGSSGAGQPLVGGPLIADSRRECHIMCQVNAAKDTTQWLRQSIGALRPRLVRKLENPEPGPGH